MNRRPTTDERSLARLLAEQLSNTGATRMLRQIEDLGFFEPHISTNVDPGKQKAVGWANDDRKENQNRVGVWVPSDRPGEWERSVRLKAQWSEWAETEKLVEKRCDHRIVIVGESIARGFLYDPAITLSTVLNSTLTGMTSSREFEVVDLAANNLTMLEAIKTTIASLALKPDVIVVVAGNNWIGSYPHLSGRNSLYELASSFRNDGFGGALSMFHADIQERSARAIESLAIIQQETGIPIIFTLPEVNLMDWSYPWVVPNWLEGTALQRWLRAYHQVKSVIDTNVEERTMDAAVEMAEIDGGFTSKALEIMGRYRMAQGDTELARVLLTRARDVARWPGSSGPPRINSAVINGVRQSCKAHDVKLIDLPLHVEEEWPNQLPDRCLYLDYCHLTSQGINFLASLIARNILTITATQTTTSNLRPNLVVPTEVDAVAKFLAAIHNDHWQQRSSVCQHWVEESLKSNPSIEAMMMGYLRMQTYSTPNWLSKTVGELAQGQARKYLSSYANAKLCTVDLGKIITDVLDQSVTPTPTATETLITWRDKDWAFKGGEVDLLDYYWRDSSTSISALFGVRPSLTTEYLPETAIYFFVHDDIAARLIVVVRVVWNTVAQSKVAVQINGIVVAETEVSSNWAKLDLTLASPVLRRGVNRLCLQWSNTNETHDFARLRAGQAIEDGEDWPFAARFGEIARLSVTALSEKDLPSI